MVAERQNNILNQLTEYITSAERYNLYWIKYDNTTEQPIQESLNVAGIQTINIGLEFAKTLYSKKITKYINIEAQELLQNLIERQSTFPHNIKIKTIALYNLGILFEPDLGLDPSQIIKALSKTTAIILLWENLSDDYGGLFWNMTKPQLGFDFTDTNLREIIIHHEI